MGGKLITFFSERWTINEIWQECQVIGQAINETLLRNKTSRFFNFFQAILNCGFLSLGKCFFTLLILNTQSL